MPTDVANTRTPTRETPAALQTMVPLIIAGGAFIALAKLLAGPLALPLLSLLLLAAGFILAAVLFLSGSRIGTSHATAWTIAAALVFLGFAGALLSDGHEALALLERMHTQGIATAAN